MIGQCRRLNITRDDLIALLNNTDPTKPPPLHTLSTETQEKVKDLGMFDDAYYLFQLKLTQKSISISLAAGSCVLKYSDEKLTISLVGWRGQTSLRAYTDTSDTCHMLRLLGADVSKYGKLNGFTAVKAVN